ncbi:MAG: hypothetical protein K2Z25_04750 [Beijerinckiaceae bacterium]|nr:hypothetical protein [Beijerinckiaceae bacterium]
MRRISTLTIGAAFAALGAFGLQAPAIAQAPAPAPSEAPRPATPPAITSVNVVDLDELPEATKAQVNQALASRTADDLQKLRNAVEAAPEIRSALEAKGLSSRDVIVAQVSQTGALTLVTKKSG